MIDVKTLGTAVVRRDGEPLDDLPARPDAFALLVHLCLNGPASREHLASLWPGDRNEGERALDEAIRALRREVGEDAAVEEDGRLRCAGDPIRCDASRLEEAAAEEDWVTVNRLYRGEFLSDVSLPGGGWSRWRDATATHLERLARRAESELRAAGEPSSPAPLSAGFWTGHFLGKLEARDVVQVAGFYVACVSAAFLTVDLLVERGLWPEWAFVVGVGVATLGFVLVAAVAWLEESEALGDEDDYWGPRWVHQTTTRRLSLGLGAAAVLFLVGFLLLRGTLPDPSGVESPAPAPEAEAPGVAPAVQETSRPPQLQADASEMSSKRTRR